VLGPLAGRFRPSADVALGEVSARQPTSEGPNFIDDPLNARPPNVREQEQLQQASNELALGIDSNGTFSVPQGDGLSRFCEVHGGALE